MDFPRTPEGHAYLIGTVKYAHYNSSLKAIRMDVKLESGTIIKHEWPITMFKARPDLEAQMEKTAQMLRGKPIKIISTADQ